MCVFFVCFYTATWTRSQNIVCEILMRNFISKLYFRQELQDNEMNLDVALTICPSNHDPLLSSWIPGDVRKSVFGVFDHWADQRQCQLETLFVYKRLHDVDHILP